MSEPPPPLDAEASCANCGRRFTGTWCPDCGQEIADVQRPLAGFLHDLLSDTFAFDARIWRTIPLLVTNPGVLAAEYVAGRRVRYVPPLRLYLFLAAVFFAVLALTGGGPFRFGVVPDSGGTSIVSAVGVEIGAAAAAVESGNRWALKLDRAARDLDGVNAIVIATLSYVHFLLLPVMAAYLKPLWRRRWFLEHLVFAAYLGAFALLTASLMVGAYGLAGNPDPPNRWAEAALKACGGILVVMAYRSARAMFGDSRIRSALKALALVFAYFLSAAVALFAIVAVTLYAVY